MESAGGVNRHITQLKGPGFTVDLDYPITRKEAMNLGLRQSLAALGGVLSSLQLGGKDGEIAKFIHGRIQEKLDDCPDSTFHVTINECDILQFFPGCDKVEAFVRFANIAKKVVDEVYKAPEGKGGFGWGEAISIKAVAEQPEKCKKGGCKVECDPCPKDETGYIVIKVDFSSCIHPDEEELAVDVVAPDAATCKTDWLSDMDPDTSTPAKRRERRGAQQSE